MTSADIVLIPFLALVPLVVAVLVWVTFLGGFPVAVKAVKAVARETLDDGRKTLYENYARATKDTKGPEDWNAP